MTLQEHTSQQLHWLAACRPQLQLSIITTAMLLTFLKCFWASLTSSKTM
jgi:hypothetical protein